MVVDSSTASKKEYASISLFEDYDDVDVDNESKRGFSVLR